MVGVDDVRRQLEMKESASPTSEVEIEVDGVADAYGALEIKNAGVAGAKEKHLKSKKWALLMLKESLKRK